MRVKLYRLQSLVSKEVFDRVNQTAKRLGVSQGELVRESVLFYLTMIECTQAKQQNSPNPILQSALLKLLEK